MLAISAQTGPVFLTYAASPAIDAVVVRAVSQAPLFDFVAADDVRHVIWTVAPHDHQALVAGFGALPG